MIESNIGINLEDVKAPAPYKVNLDRMYRDQMEEKSSFIIKGNIENPMLPALLDGKKGPHGVDFPLSPALDPNKQNQPIVFSHSISWAAITKRSCQNTVNFHTEQEYYGTGSVRVHLSKNNKPYGRRESLCFGKFSVTNLIEGTLKDALNVFRNILSFLLVYCQALHGKTAEFICTFFGYTPNPVGEKVTSPLYHSTFFYKHTECSDIMEAENTIKSLSHSIDKTGILPVNITEFPMVFPFENTDHITNLKIAVVYNHFNRTKSFIPYTAYIQTGSNEPELFGFIASKLIPWSCADLDGKEVVVTSDIEFAYLNLEVFLNAGKTLISHPEVFGRYDLLDYAALKRASKVHLLIANFNGLTFAEACIAAKPLALTLQEHLKPEQLFYLTMQISYPEIPDNINTTKQLAGFLKESPAKVKKSHLFFDKDEFDSLITKAEQEIYRKSEAMRDIDFLSAVPAPENKGVAASEKSVTQTNWLIRSVIEKAGYVEVIAPEKTGKSNFSVSLAMLLTNPKGRKKGLIDGRYLTVSNGVNGKVLYLDAEMSRPDFERIKDRFRKAYWPCRKEDSEICENNLIYRDLRNDGIPYAARENHSKILRLVDEAIQEGTPGLDVDLVIIDTKRGFTKKNMGLEPQLTELVEKIQKRGIAVLVIHHMASDPADDGAGRKDVTCNKTGMIKLWRDYVAQNVSRDKCKLYHPIKVQLSGYRNYITEFDSDAFYVRFTEDKWELVEIDGDEKEIDTLFKPVAFDEPKIIKSMIKEYKSMCKINRSDIADYLGITDDTLKAWETGK